MRAFFLDLDVNDRLLSRFGWMLCGLVPVFALVGFFHPGTLQGVNPWIKPIKFSISFATFVWTVSLFLRSLRIPQWQVILARFTVAGSVMVEMICLGAQAWRMSQPHAPGLADTMMNQATAGMVMINTALVIWILALFCHETKWSKLEDGAMAAAIRISIVIFLIGNAVGGYMLARGTHSIGVHDGGPGLPLVNWSTVAGDLRIAHFIGIHAIQIVPVFAYLVCQMSPRPGVRQRRMAVYAAAAALSFLVAGTFVQAALGHPLIPWGR
jgi:hypothetical protein